MGKTFPRKQYVTSMKDNPVTLPINLYAVAPPEVQPLDIDNLGEVGKSQGDNRVIYKQTKSVCLCEKRRGQPPPKMEH